MMRLVRMGFVMGALAATLGCAANSSTGLSRDPTATPVRVSIVVPPVRPTVVQTIRRHRVERRHRAQVRSPHARLPYTVPGATKSFRITVNNATAGIVNTPSPGAYTATITAPPGTNTFDVYLYDAADAGGNMLTMGETSATVSATGPNSVSIFAYDFIEYDAVPPGTAGAPFGITSAGGNLWITLEDICPATCALPALGDASVGGKPVMVMSTSGALVARYATVGQLDSLLDVIVGPDANLWFGEDGSGFHKMTPAGADTRYAFGAANYPAGIGAMTIGPDNNIWFVDEDRNQIGRVTTAGVVTEFAYPCAGCTPGPSPSPTVTASPAPTASGATPPPSPTPSPPFTPASEDPVGIASGPDGNIWFTQNADNKVAYLNTSGAGYTSFGVTGGSEPYQIVNGPGGALWFASIGAIGRVTPSGQISYTSIPGEAKWLVAGPDGALWFTMPELNQIGRLSPNGSLGFISLPPSATANPLDREVTRMVVGPDGNIWYTAQDANKIGKICLTVCRALF